jgi:hypothetical protein
MVIIPMLLLEQGAKTEAFGSKDQMFVDIAESLLMQLCPGDSDDDDLEVLDRPLRKQRNQS